MTRLTPIVAEWHSNTTKTKTNNIKEKSESQLAKLLANETVTKVIRRFFCDSTFIVL